MKAAAPERWYRDPAALSLVLLGYLPWLAGLNLAWEAAHLPLYTVWREASPAYLVFTVMHCTLGDLAIGASALVVALVASRSSSVDRWRFGRIAALTALIGMAYTAFSEWMNTMAQNWRYAELMPVVRAFDVEIGLSPLAQWLIIPPLALALARRMRAWSRLPGFTR